jgi:uncharacterized protein YdaU (DUF1376 family)
MMRDIQFTTVPENSREAFVFYAQDWLASFDVRWMTTIQRGFYIQLIAQMLNNPKGRWLPNDDKELWRLAGARSKQEWDRNRESVLKLWILDEKSNTWGCPRLMRDGLDREDWERENEGERYSYGSY